MCFKEGESRIGTLAALHLQRTARGPRSKIAEVAVA